MSVIITSAILSAAWAFALQRNSRRRSGGSALIHSPGGSLSPLADCSDAALFRLDQNGHIAEANDLATSELGYGIDELRGLNFRALHDAVGQATLDQKTASALPGEWSTYEANHIRKDGKLLPVENSIRSVTSCGIRNFQVTSRSTFQRRAVEGEIDKLNRFYAVLSQVNQSVVHSKSKEELFSRVCKAATGVGGFKLAWIGRINADSGLVEIVESAGESVRFLDEVVVTIDGRPEGQGAVGTSYRERRPVIINDFQHDPTTSAWHERAVWFGLAGCASFPIGVRGNIEGSLVIYTGERGLFGQREVALLKEVAGDISFGLETLRRDRERKDVEEALRTSERRFRRLIEQAPDAIYVHSEGKFRFLNDAAAKLFGAANPGRLVGCSVLDRIHPSYLEIVRERLSRIESIRLSVPLHEHKYLRLDGTAVDVEVTAAPILYEDKPSAAVFVRDVSERYLYQARLREQSALLDNATDAIIVCSLDRRVQYWNKGSERLYGWTSEEAMDRSLVELLSAEQPKIDLGVRTALERGEWSGDVEKASKSRERITVLCRLTLIRDSNGKPKSILSIDTDVTEKKKLEAQFLRAQRLESVGQLAGGIAHDLNNILSPILMAVPLLRLDEVSDEKKEVLGMVETCATRGSRIVQQILQFSRGDAGDVKPLNVMPLISEIAHLAKETFPRNITVKSQVPTDIWQIVGDHTQLHQVLMNLSVNARDAMPSGGILQLTAENIVFDEPTAANIPGAKPGHYVAWVVSDTGTGIPPEIIDRIFDPFFTTKEMGKGTGLGLSTVIGIVQRHGGFTRVESKEGQGTQFRIYLPALDGDRSVEFESDDQDIPCLGGSETILIVDDEESIRAINKRILEKAGYKVLLASDGAEALMVFTQRREEIDVIITDIMMPVMDGNTLARVLMKTAPSLKLITCSGLDNTKLTSPPFSNPLASLKKPVSQRILLQAIRHSIDGTSPENVRIGAQLSEEQLNQPAKLAGETN